MISSYIDEGFVEVVRVHNCMNGFFVLWQQVDDEVSDFLSDNIVAIQWVFFCFLDLLLPLLLLLSPRIECETRVADVQRYCFKRFEITVIVQNVYMMVDASMKLLLVEGWSKEEREGARRTTR